MSTRIAFLRAINVGGHTVTMARLAALFEEAGLHDVRTFINSGNVAFAADRRRPTTVEDLIEGHLEAALGYAVATFVRSDAELAAIAAADPFADRDGTVHVAFLKEPLPAAGHEALRALTDARNEFASTGREAWWWTPSGMTQSGLRPDAVPKALGKAAHTLRNRTTVARLVERHPPR